MYRAATEIAASSSHFFRTLYISFYIFIYLYIYLSICVYFYLSVYRSKDLIFYLSVLYMSMYLYIYMSILYRTASNCSHLVTLLPHSTVHIYRNFYPYVYVSIHLSVYLYFYSSVYMYIQTSIYLSILYKAASNYTGTLAISINQDIYI